MFKLGVRPPGLRPAPARRPDRPAGRQFQQDRAVQLRQWGQDSGQPGRPGAGAEAAGQEGRGQCGGRR